MEMFFKVFPKICNVSVRKLGFVRAKDGINLAKERIKVEVEVDFISLFFKGSCLGKFR